MRHGHDVLAGEGGGGDPKNGVTGQSIHVARQKPYHPGMDRRRFLLTSLAGALAVPLAAEAQTGANMPRLCFLTFDPGTLRSTRFGAFFQGLRDLGYVDGQTLTIDYL
jgi:hypothetical protein